MFSCSFWKLYCCELSWNKRKNWFSDIIFKEVGPLPQTAQVHGTSVSVNIKQYSEGRSELVLLRLRAQKRLCEHGKHTAVMKFMCSANYCTLSSHSFQSTFFCKKLKDLFLPSYIGQSEFLCHCFNEINMEILITKGPRIRIWPDRIWISVLWVILSACTKMPKQSCEISLSQNPRSKWLAELFFNWVKRLRLWMWRQSTFS